VGRGLRGERAATLGRLAGVEDGGLLRVVPASRNRRGWAFWVGLVISLGCIVWAFLTLDFRQVVAALKQARWDWLFFAAVAVLLRIAARAARWRSLFAAPRPGYRASLSALLVGQTINYVTPGWAGDLTRAFLVGEHAEQSKGRALGTVAVEKVLDLVLFLCFLAFLSLCMELPEWLRLPARTLGLIALAGLAVIAMGLVQRARIERVLKWALLPLPATWRERGLGLADRLLDGLAALRSPRMLAQAGFWSLLMWAWDAAANYAALRALGLHLPLLAPLLLSVALRAVFAVSAVPGQVGVYEGIVVMSLSLFEGVDAESAFSAGLLRHAAGFIPPLVITLLLVAFWHPERKDVAVE
jgi:uncharacterized protein (TIRG00374 family)